MNKKSEFSIFAITLTVTVPLTPGLEGVNEKIKLNFKTITVLYMSFRNLDLNY